MLGESIEEDERRNDDDAPADADEPAQRSSHESENDQREDLGHEKQILAKLVVFGVVPNVFSDHHEDDVLSDVRGVIRDPLQISGNQNEAQRPLNR